MSTYTIRPDALIWGGGYFAATGAASILAAVNDNSDASYIRTSSQQYGEILFGYPDPSISATEFPDRIEASPRVSGTSGNYTGFAVDTDADATPNPPRASDAAYAVWRSAQHSHASATNVPLDMARKWTNGMAATLRLAFRTYEQFLVVGANRAYYYDLPVVIKTQALAAVAPTPTTITTTTTPTIPATVTADIDTWQLPYSSALTMRIEMQIESGGTGIGTGTVMETITKDVTYDATAGTGRTLATSLVFTESLVNGEYKVYARVARQRTLYPGEWLYGAWSSVAALTMQLTLPAAPTLALTPDQTNDRVSVSVTPVATTDYSSPTIEVERSNDGGTTYTAVRGMTAIAGTFGAASAMGYDYESIRGIAAKYRARITATHTNASVNVGAWSTVAETTITATGWNLKCPETPALNAIGVSVIGNPSEDVEEDIGVFRTLGRRYPVVVSGTLTGWDGQLDMQTSTAAEWTAIKGVIEAQKILLLESPFGVSKYIRLIGGAQTAIAGTPGAPRRSVKAAYVETEAP